MGEFLALLAIYYTCDSAAAMRPLAGDEMRACMASYDAVKVWFIEDWDLAPRGSLRRFEQNLQGYESFKAWEAENPGLVAAMRANAEDEVRRGGVPAVYH